LGSRWIVTGCLFVLLSALALMPFTASADPLKADFEAHPPISGPAPFTVQFLDHSTGEFSRFWSFGDGQTSTDSDPVHTYTAPGSYTVILTVYDAAGTAADTKTVPGYITVSGEPGGSETIATAATTVPATATPYPSATATTTVPSTTATPALAGTIEVISVPSGAMTSLDGAEQGITPITLYKVPAGTHTVRLHSKGYTDNESSVIVEDQKTIHLAIVMATGSTKVTPAVTSPAATVTETSVAEGQKAAAYVPAPPVAAGRTGSLLFQCSNCVPGQGVLLDDRYAPYTKDLVFRNVAPGIHMVKIVDPAIQCTQTTYTTIVQPGEQAAVNGHACTPGFTSILAVLALAGITGFRKLRR